MLVAVVALFVGPLHLVNPVWASATSKLAVDGSAASFCSHSTNSCQASLTTSHGNDIIIVYTLEQLDLQTSCTFSVSDSASLTWTARSSVVFGNGGRDQIQEFYAKSSGTLSSDTITESISGCAGIYGGEYNGLLVFGISGASFSTPFDPNASLPGTASGNGNTAATSISTTNADDMIIGGAEIGSVTAGTGYTSITSINGNSGAEYALVSSTQTSKSVIFTGTSGTWMIIGDAIQGALFVDGSTSAWCGHNTNSCTAPLTTSYGNDIVIVYALEALDLQTSCTFSVSDTAGLSWTSRTAIVFGNNGRDQLQEFYAKSSNPLTSDTITETISGCASTQYGGEYNGLLAFGVAGANFNSPFDPNTSLPGTANGNGNTPATTISTSYGNDIIIAGARLGGLQPGSGFASIIYTDGTNDLSEYQLVSTTQTNLTVSFTGNTGYWEIAADAIEG